MMQVRSNHKCKTTQVLVTKRHVLFLDQLLTAFNLIVQQQQQAAGLPPSSSTQQQQPKELIDFFASLENEKVNIFYNPVVQQQPMFAPVVTQPTGHNPFRNDTQQLSMVPQQSTSSILPSVNTNLQVNPFRASTMPQMSISTPTPYAANTFSMGTNSFNNNLMQQQSTLNMNNPFAPSTNMPPPTLMVASPTTVVGENNHNPFTNNASKQQQLQPWGSSIF
jgi:hypothetical protein